MTKISANISIKLLRFHSPFYMREDGAMSGKPAGLVNAMLTDATFDLDLGPSVNAMYANAPGRGRIKSKAYNSWIRGQLKALLAQRARPVQTPVSLTIHLPATMRGDASNRIKSCEDLLVKAGIIPNDSKDFVQSVTISFHDAAQMRVRVQTCDKG